MFNCEKYWQNLQISRLKLNQTFLNVLLLKDAERSFK